MSTYWERRTFDPGKNITSDAMMMAVIVMDILELLICLLVEDPGELFPGQQRTVTFLPKEVGNIAEA